MEAFKGMRLVRHVSCFKEGGVRKWDALNSAKIRWSKRLLQAGNYESGRKI